MNRKYSYPTRLAWVLVVLTVLTLSGCAAKKALWGEPDSGLILTYRVAEDKGLQYQLSGEGIQDLNIMGQSMITKRETGMGFSVASKGRKEKNLVLGITMDKMAVNITGSHGNMSPDMDLITGKSFDMTLSPLGKELKLSGATTLTYQTGSSGKNSIKSMFDSIFPDLPAHPVKVGDTWTSTDDVSNDDNSTKTHTIMENVNVLEGFETVDGQECVKITSKMSGSMEGEGSQMGSVFTFNGELKGSATWYFAYKEGVLVGMKKDLTGNIGVDTMGVTIPMTTENTEEIKLIQ